MASGTRDVHLTKLLLCFVATCFCVVVLWGSATTASYAADGVPAPLLKKGQPVDWWFVFKFNTAAFPGCGGGAERVCLFGGDAQNYKEGFGQQFVYASSDNDALKKGSDCAGDATDEPIGATFDEVYNGSFFYVIWNDQFYDDPAIAGCTKECGSPWGHSKGMVVWNDAGDGFVMQVTTPSWPAAGNRDHPRRSDGNTLGCVKDDNVEVSQHFFALKLTKNDLAKVLTGLRNASVVTDPNNPQIVNNGGPADVRALVTALGTKSTSAAYTDEKLSSGVELIAKPSRLNVPPWQMVSAVLGRIPLRAATWWSAPRIFTTTASQKVACWDEALGKPGAVEIAETGAWEGTTFGLQGSHGRDSNHAKIGVSTSGDDHYVIFGDMNQQGTLNGPNCASSQNGRGGLFFVMRNMGPFEGVTKLIAGDTAPLKPPSN